MSLSLYGVPEGQKNRGQSISPCPSVYSPAAALRSLSSVALSSAQADQTLSLVSTKTAFYIQISATLSGTFINEATNHLSGTFINEATGMSLIIDRPILRALHIYKFARATSLR